MFTKKSLFDWRLRPHKSVGSDLVSNPRSNGDTSDDGKGKSVGSAAYTEQVSPHSGSLDGGGVGEAADWQRFREAGLLDESSMEKQDREALLQKISKLEQELYDYQYNMGLLLIERKDLASIYEKLRQAFAEAQETLRQEQTAHLMALSEAKKREEDLRKALEIEKQCVADYKKALRAICPETEETELTSDKKIGEGKLGVEMEQELNKKEITEVTLSKQSEELQDWEKCVHEMEGKQVSGTTSNVSAGAAVVTSEENLGSGETNSVGRRKRRVSSSHGSQTPGERKYNLRQRKT